MEDDGQRRLLVVDEKETCLAQFVPANNFEQIWKQESPPKLSESIDGDESLEYDAYETESVKSMQGKVKPAENPLFRRKVVEEVTRADLLLSSPKEIAAKFDEIVRDGPKIYRDYLRGIFSAINSGFITIVQLVLLFLGNRWAWNISVIIVKLSLAIFFYLVIACSTGIIAIIFNLHDAYVKLKLEKSGKIEEVSKNKDDLEKTSVQETRDRMGAESYQKEKTTAVS